MPVPAVLLLLATTVVCAQVVEGTGGSDARLGTPDAELTEALPGTVSISADTTMQKGEQPPPEFLEVEVPPEITTRTNPVYPEDALKQGLNGTVWVKIWVDKSGKPRAVAAVKSTNEIFNQSALDAARQWQFSPARLHDKPVDVWVTIPFKYTLKDDKEQRPDTTATDAYSLQKIAQTVIAGVSGEDLRAVIDPEACMITGHDYRSMYDVLGDTQRYSPFAEDRGRTISFSLTKMNDTATLAYLVFSTAGAKESVRRFHTVIFARAKGGSWKIQHWHAGQ
jgi:protein TonB